MNKNDLVSAVSDSVGLSKTEAANAVDSVFNYITSSLQSGNEVRLVGFGTFSTVQR
ncbi:MAG: HU family DNA-binding protein, partial [Proteobacteria bacterium]